MNFCPSCGAKPGADARFCDACGYNLSPDITTPEVRTPDIRTPDIRTPEMLMGGITGVVQNTPDMRVDDIWTPEIKTPDIRMPDIRTPEMRGFAPLGHPQFSADGKWWWNGAQWTIANRVAAPMPATPPPAAPMSTATTPKMPAYMTVFIWLLVAAFVFVFIFVFLPKLTGSVNTITPRGGGTAITITSAGAIACKTTVHGGYVYEVNCDSSVTLLVSGDVASRGVFVGMDSPYGSMHGGAAVPQGFRGTITVPIHTQNISSTCTAYPNYATTVYVYDGIIVNSGPQLASKQFIYHLGCS